MHQACLPPRFPWLQIGRREGIKGQEKKKLMKKKKQPWILITEGKLPRALDDAQRDVFVLYWNSWRRGLEYLWRKKEETSRWRVEREHWSGGHMPHATAGSTLRGGFRSGNGHWKRILLLRWVKIFRNRQTARLSVETEHPFRLASSSLF